MRILFPISFPVVLAALAFSAALPAREPARTHDIARYGPALEFLSSLPLGQTIDLTVHNGYLFVIGGYFTGGTLFVADISEPAAPRIVARLEGLGNLRQIECAGSFAYLAARDDGLYIIDISDPLRPRLRCRYDTLEKATGVAVAHPLVAVANRHYGVELVDVSDPDSPRYLGNPIGAREVQSVDLRDGFLYAGVWASREVITVDVRDPLRPVVTQRNPLDGYGDGVRAAGSLLLAATGHHASAFQGAHHNSQTLGQNGFGTGHGLEIFSRLDPARPAFLSRLKTPPFYKGMPDMWSAEASGSLAVLSDVFNGIFVVDLGDPAKPRFVGHTRMPWVEERKEFDAVAAVAAGDGVVYAAGYYSGLHTLACRGLAPEPSRPATSAVLAPTAPAQVIAIESDVTRYRPSGQVRAIALLGEGRAALAVGNAGIHVIEYRPRLSVLSVTPTGDIAYDIAARGNLLFVAEAAAGVSVFEIHADSTLTLRGRHIAPALSARQIVLAAGQPYALIENPARYQYRFEIIDVADPAAIRPVLSERGPGMLHGREIAPRLYGGRHAVLHWHTAGPVWYDLAARPPRRMTDYRAIANTYLEGVCVLDDNIALAFYGGGYRRVTPHDRGRITETAPIRLPDGEPMSGVAISFGSTLVLSDGAAKVVRIVDISDLDHPRLREKILLRGNPGRAAARTGDLLIPEGHDGLSIRHRPWLK